MAKLLNVMFGVLIPSAASVALAALAFLIEHRASPVAPHLPASIFDISVGCMFAVAGVAATTAVVLTSRKYFAVFFVVLILVLAGMVVPVYYPDHRIATFVFVNFVAFLAASAVVYAG